MSTVTIVANIIKCKHCNDIIESYYVHDFNMCKCGKCSVDGGLCYLKRTGLKDDYTEFSVYSSESHNIIRQYAFRSGLGKPGTSEYGSWKVTKICDMDDEYLSQAILYVQNMINKNKNDNIIINHLTVLQNEKLYRKKLLS